MCYRFDNTFSYYYFTCRDGLQESNIVSKQFVVDDVGTPDEDDIEFLESDIEARWCGANGSTQHRKVSWTLRCDMILLTYHRLVVIKMCHDPWYVVKQCPKILMYSCIRIRISFILTHSNII